MTDHLEETLADIRKAIADESVSYDQLAILQDTAESNPAALAGDIVLREWAGLPE